MDKISIAPCGMNCLICSRHLAFKNNILNQGIGIPYCLGCRKKNNKCAFQKKCDLLSKSKIEYCFQCPNFPCERLKKLDERYRNRYHMSMIENLEYIKENGIDQFLTWQEEKWRCPRCGGFVCCHNGLCFSCDLEKLKILVKKRQPYRWEE